MREGGDPHLSAVLDELAVMLRAVVGPVIDAGLLSGFSSLQVYGFSDMPTHLSPQPNELTVVHYPRSVEINDVTTADDVAEGIVTMVVGIVVMAVVGFNTIDMGTLAARSADVPEILKRAYLANATFTASDGSWILSAPLSVNNARFGTMPFAEQPIGWSFDLTLVLEYRMRSFLF